MAMTTLIGMLLYPGLTQLDLRGPFELLRHLPDAKIHLVWKDTKPVFADSGLGLLPTTTFAEVPPVDLLFVPGGAGQIELTSDADVLEFLRAQGERAKYVTSVCTGAFLLGAAGLLRGYRATTHWASMDLLPLVGAIPVQERVVVDRNRITAGGVTAGIDFGLRIIAQLAGDDAAKRAQLRLEYDPSPPFQSGHPRVADPDVVEAVKSGFSDRIARRAAELRRLLRAAK
jgi:cyclohexyl-isocyanide hydratase